MEKNAEYSPQYPSYGEQPAYTTQAGYNAQPGYGAQPGYDPQPGYVPQTGYAVPPPAPPAAQPPLQALEQQGWFVRNQKNKPQSNSAGAAAMIFLSGGMNIAWSVGFSSHTPFRLTMHIRICWFVAAIIGAIIGAVLTNKIKKKILFLIAIVMTLVSGILFISVPRNYDAVMAARYIDGIANGLIFVPTLVLAGEEAVKSMRAMLTSSLEVMCFNLGIFLQLLYSSQWTKEMSQSFDVLQMQGLLSIIDGVIALLIAIYLFVESPIYFLVRGQEEMAIDSLRRLQRPFIVTQETFQQLEDHKRYVADNKEISFAQSALQGLPALFKLCYFRGMLALGFSTMMYYGLEISSGDFTEASYIFCGTMLYTGSLICVFVINKIGRRNPVILGAVICSGMALGVAIIFDRASNVVNSSQMYTAMSLIFVYQFFSGFYSAVSSAYLSEAFPLAIKPYYIAMAFIVEMVVEIIICCCAFDLEPFSPFAKINAVSSYFYAVAALSFVMTLMGALGLPETKQTSLSEAQAKFRHLSGRK